MKLVDILEKIWITIQIMGYSIIGLAPLSYGGYSVYISQTAFFKKNYQPSMHLGIGIISIIVGIPILWACFVRVVQLVRYNNSLN